jgi:hypothetical protein
MKNNKEINRILNSSKVYFRFALVMSLLCVLSREVNGQVAELIASPDFVEVSVDDTFEVTMNIETAGHPLAVADIHLRFDPYYLEIVEVEALAANGFNVLPAIINNTEGALSINAFQLGEESVIPAFPLVKITMRALAETQGTTVSHPQDVFPRTILAFAGEELNTFASPIEVVINGTDPLSSISQEVEGLSLAVWPNPTDGLSNAQFSIPNGGNATLEVFNVSGISVMRVFHGSAPSRTSQNIELDLKSLADGIYFIRLLSEDGNLVQRIALNK